MIWRESVGVKWKGNTADYQWRWHLRNRYKITQERVDEMLAAQGGFCPICLDSLGKIDAAGRQVKVCVDHDHLTNEVRGLLCDPCNMGLGQFRDDHAIISRAAAYLLNHSQKGI